MIRFSLLLLFACFALRASAQKNEVSTVLDSIIRHAQTASVYRNAVKWDSVVPIIRDFAKNARSVPELGPALKYLLQVLGDEHGRVFYNGQVIAYYYGEQKPHQMHFRPEWYQQIQGGQTYPFKTELLSHQIGYVRIAGLPMGDNAKMALDIQEPLCELARKGAQKWIIDLRYNGGGNLNPMAEGLAPLLGNDTLGGAQGLTPAESPVWEIKNGDFYNFGYSIALPNRCALSDTARVAVLTSLYTASSGEALAAMFKGRPNTRFFGEKTLGMVTGTNWTLINDSVAVSISTNFFKDRKGVVYRNYVEPDEAIPFSPVEHPADDAGIQRAAAWLKE